MKTDANGDEIHLDFLTEKKVPSEDVVNRQSGTVAAIVVKWLESQREVYANVKESHCA